MASAARAGLLLVCVGCCMMLWAPVATASAAQQANKRVVRIGVLNPTPGVAASQVSTHEGEAASFKIDNVGSFKFVPTIQKNDDKTVVLTILDADTGHQIDQLHLSVGGKPAQPKGLPFQLRIIEVTTPK